METEAKIDYRSRLVTDEDKPTLEAWWKSHRGEELHSQILSPIGVMVELHGQPVAAIFAYLSINIGVAFLESPITMPGLQFNEACLAMRHCLGAIEAVLKTHNYTHIVTHCDPAAARFLERGGGYRVTNRGLVQLTRELQG